MKAKDLINEISRILSVDTKELAVEYKGKSLIVRRYSNEVEGLIVGKYNARKDSIEILNK